MNLKSELMDASSINRSLRRLTHEIIEKNRGTKDLVIVGIRNRGDSLARRVIKAIQEIEKVNVPLGVLDITLYRDDFQRVTDHPVVQSTDIDTDITDKRIVLVDDVLYTGRTIRAALDALVDFGRPAVIQLAVLVDRGHRELPIKPDYVGKNVPTAQNEQVEVKLKEIDGEDKVLLLEL
jgi:pyrimidine operon attenuation protein/uracil phosphoribosyltransferase